MPALAVPSRRVNISERVVEAVGVAVEVLRVVGALHVGIHREERRHHWVVHAGSINFSLERKVTKVQGRANGPPRMAGAAPYPVHGQRAHPGRGLAFPVGIDADGNAVCEALSHVFLVFRRCKVITLQPKSQEKSKNSLVHDMFFKIGESKVLQLTSFPRNLKLLD